MPVINEEVAPSRRKRSSRARWLLLLPPLFLVMALAAATVQPLELGPIVLVSQFLRGSREGCRVTVEPYPDPIFRHIVIRGRVYRWHANGVALATDIHYVGYSLGWFWGRRVQSPGAR